MLYIIHLIFNYIKTTVHKHTDTHTYAERCIHPYTEEKILGNKYAKC